MDSTETEYWRQRIKHLAEGTHIDRLMPISRLVELVEQKLADRRKQREEEAPP